MEQNERGNHTCDCEAELEDEMQQNKQEVKNEENGRRKKEGKRGGRKGKKGEAQTEHKLKKKVILPEFKYTVDMDEWQTTMELLTSMNRYAGEGTNILEAGKFLKEKLEKNDKLEVSCQQVDVLDFLESYNVIAKLRGTQYPEIYYVIGAHYDSISEDVENSAPGALDNASGTAAVLEMARIFSELSVPFTFIFVLFTGEELGLKGSRKFVADMKETEEIEKIKMMLNMDMVARNENLIIEAVEADVHTMWRQVAELNGIKPIIRNYMMARSDHRSFHEEGIIRSIHTGNKKTDYPHYHKTSDVMANLSSTVAHRILNTNIIAILQLMIDDLDILEKRRRKGDIEEEREERRGKGKGGKNAKKDKRKEGRQRRRDGGFGNDD